METYISKLDGARLYVGDVNLSAGDATELTRPLAECVARKMNILVVEPLRNGDVLIQEKSPNGKVGLMVIPRAEARCGMGVSNALHAKGVRLPRWVRYAIDLPVCPVVAYWREKSIR